MNFLNLPTVKQFSSLSLKVKLICLYLMVLIPLCLLGYKHVSLAQQHLQLQSAQTTTINTQHNSHTPVEQHAFESEVIQTTGLILIIFSSLSFVMIIIMMSANQQSSKLHKSLVDFNHGHFQCRLEAHNLTDLEKIAGEINLLGMRQNRIHQKVSNAMDEVIYASQEMNKVVLKSADGTMEQIQAVARVASAIEEMSNSITNAANHADDSNTMAKESADLASEGETKVHEMHQEMTSIHQMVDGSTSTIESLLQRSHEIGQIIGVIQGISEQTNLLALNAAIEAARAGDHGRGFSIVADEVRSLAIKTSNATVDIRDLIDKMATEVNQIVENNGSVRSSVNTGMEMSSQAKSALSIISQHALATKGKTTEISIALNQQTLASNEISNSIHRITEMAEINSLSINETKSAASYLEKLSKHLTGELKS